MMRWLTWEGSAPIAAVSGATLAAQDNRHAAGVSGRRWNLRLHTGNRVVYRKAEPIAAAMYRATVGLNPSAQALDGLVGRVSGQRTATVQQCDDRDDATAATGRATPGPYTDLARLQFQQQRDRQHAWVSGRELAPDEAAGSADG